MMPTPLQNVFTVPYGHHNVAQHKTFMSLFQQFGRGVGRD